MLFNRPSQTVVQSYYCKMLKTIGIALRYSTSMSSQCRLFKYDVSLSVQSRGCSSMMSGCFGGGGSFKHLSYILKEINWENSSSSTKVTTEEPICKI